MGKNGGRNEYLTEWASGETTWEPAQSFRDTQSSYIPIFDEFKGRMEAGEVKQITASIEQQEDRERRVYEEIAAAIEQRMRVLKMVVKAGVEVPETRKEAQTGKYGTV